MSKGCKHKFEVLDCKLYGVPPTMSDGLQVTCIKCGYIKHMFKDKILVHNGIASENTSKWFKKQIAKTLKQPNKENRGDTSPEPEGEKERGE